MIAGSTLNTTGNKSITGVGFKPKMVKFRLLNQNSVGAGANGCEGVMTASAQNVYLWAAGSTYNNTYASTTSCMGWITASASTSTPSALAKYVSMDNDGFTINVTTASGLDFAYEAYA